MCGSALTAGDLAHARLPSFKRRVAGALTAISAAREKGRIGVSFSGGKDSTVLLDLARKVEPDIAAAFFDSGCEYTWTYDMIAHYAVTPVLPAMSLLDMCRYGGYWGYRTPTDPDATFQFGEVLVKEPSARFVREQGLSVVGIGLRGQESRGRLISAKVHGDLYWVKSESVWHLCPLSQWKVQDIWAYIASRDLRYNHAYDRMADAGIPREEWRVSTLLGVVGAGIGRYCFLRQVDPEMWARLSAEFPKIVRYT